MMPRRVFGLSVVTSLLSSAAAAILVWPRVETLGLVQALIWLVAPHMFLRFIGLSFLLPGVVSPSLPREWAAPAAYGDVVAGILAIVATSALATGAAWATAAVWVFNIVGAGDLISDVRPKEEGSTLRFLRTLDYYPVSFSAALAGELRTDFNRKGQDAQPYRHDHGGSGTSHGLETPLPNISSTVVCVASRSFTMHDAEDDGRTAPAMSLTQRPWSSSRFGMAQVLPRHAESPQPAPFFLWLALQDNRHARGFARPGSAQGWPLLPERPLQPTRLFLPRRNVPPVGSWANMHALPGSDTLPVHRHTRFLIRAHDSRGKWLLLISWFP